MGLNILWINGWLGAAPSWALHQLRRDTNAVFGNKIYSPEPVNHHETDKILRLVKEWRDPVIMVGLSCGCSTINEVTKWVPVGERIVFAQYYSPSFPCGIGTRNVPPAIDRAQEVNSWPLDFFNLGARQAIALAPGNTKTKLLPRLKTMNGHGTTPLNAQARAILHNEIRRALA